MFQSLIENPSDNLAVFIQDLRKSFRGMNAINGLHLDVRRGECFGLLGPNGAGKTTTIEICEGLTSADSGTVRILGLNWRLHADELRRRIGVQLQETQFAEKLTVEETISLFRSFFDRGFSAEQCIEKVQLKDKRKALVGGLSGGEKQRLALGCALVGDPELLFLDEPTAGLDPQARRHLWDIVDQLKANGRTVILTTHYMDEAQRLCDRVGIMDHGQIIALGSPKELMASVGGEQIVEFSLDANASFNGATLMEITGVQSHSIHAGLHQLLVRDLHTTAPLIFSRLKAGGLQLTEFRTHSATLEDVFISLTGRSLRDG
jgi:ABC-2 type transport system ATP-binding protein